MLFNHVDCEVLTLQLIHGSSCPAHVAHEQREAARRQQEYERAQIQK